MTKLLGLMVLECEVHVSHWMNILLMSSIIDVDLEMTGSSLMSQVSHTVGKQQTHPHVKDDHVSVYKRLAPVDGHLFAFCTPDDSFAPMVKFLLGSWPAVMRFGSALASFAHLVTASKLLLAGVPRGCCSHWPTRSHWPFSFTKERSRRYSLLKLSQNPTLDPILQRLMISKDSV